MQTTSYYWLRKLLFCLPPEFAHRLTLKLMPWFYSTKRVLKLRQQFVFDKPIRLAGLSLPNPLGIAAGFDKNGEAIDALFGLGFGFVEVGAVTPLPQRGNPKPRIFRLINSQALINRMGFNNKGVDYLVQQLKKRKVAGIVGVNIGKNKITSLENAHHDYLICLEKLYNYADFITINISSPNTPQLRELQTEQYLNQLLKTIIARRNELNNIHKKSLPLFIKLAPDLIEDELSEIIHTLLAVKIDGVILTNTTQSRLAVTAEPMATQAGGLSGRPLKPLALSAVKTVANLSTGKLPIIAVGGIFSAADALEFLAAGASAVQLYTGLIYEGPGLVQRILTALAKPT